MAYQEGSEEIAFGAGTVEVEFDTPFDAAPDIVIPVVTNSIDSPPDVISAFVTSISTTGFTVDLSESTGTENYVLRWIAGSADLVFTTRTVQGRRAADMPLQEDVPSDGDSLLGLVRSPKQKMVQVPWSLMRSLFPALVEAPLAPETDGGSGSVAVDNEYFYVRHASGWGRISFNAGPWGGNDGFHQRTHGIADISEGGTTVAVEFDTPFPEDGDPPSVVFSIEHTDEDPVSAFLNGVITERTVEGFTVTFSDEAGPGLKLHWTAVSV